MQTQSSFLHLSSEASPLPLTAATTPAGLDPPRQLPPNPASPLIHMPSPVREEGKEIEKPNTHQFPRKRNVEEFGRYVGRC
jgi:hypothetical protein